MDVPPPQPKDPRRRRAALMVAGGAAVLALVVAVLVTRDGGDDPVRVAGKGPAAVSTTSSTSLAGTTTLLPGQVAPGAGGTDAPAGPGAGSPDASGGNPVDARSSALEGGVGGGEGVPAGADSEPPSVGGPTMEPATIWETAGEVPCPGGSPATATVSVVADDPSGIGSVTLDLGGPLPGSIAMTSAGGSTYTATVGPFPRGTVPPGATENIPLGVRAIDGAGNASVAPATLMLQSCP